MAMQVGGKKGGPMADINVTPLVDVVLVLLIIFMVVTPMLSSGVDVKLPKAKNVEATQDVGQNLVVSIRNDDAVFVDTKRSSNDDLVSDINEAYRADPSRSLLIKGDRELKWKQVKEIMDIINDGGMHTMLLAAEKKKEL
jgi:biopolymer transport protein TolR